MPDKIKTGTLSFHSSYNYGSMLQAYALQRALFELGYDNEIIDLRTPVQKKLYSRFSPFKSRGITNFLEKVFIKLRFGRALNLQYDRFSSFLASKMKKSIECTSQEDVEKSVSTYDVLISGGDQIWNSGCVDFDWSYLLPFEGVGKISYAPSFGPCFSNSLLADYLEIYRKHLLSYDSLSSREKDGVELINKICGRSATTVPDPVFLLDRAEWDNLYPEKPIVDGDYLLIYSPHRYGKDFRRTAEYLAAKHSLKVVVCNYAALAFDIPARSEFHLDTGPEQFLNLVKNAALVLCTSFHAVAFSILFKRPFLAIEGENDSRIWNVLETFHLESRTISIRSLERKSENALNMDFSGIDEILTSQKTIGINYLQNSLEHATVSRH